MNSPSTDWAAQPDSGGLIRRAMLVLLALLAPVLWIVDMSGMDANVGLADFVMPLAAAGWLWRMLSGKARIPLASICCFMVASVIVSLLFNAELALKTRGPASIVIEMVKIGLLWLYFYVTVDLVSSRRSLMLLLKTWLVGSGLVALTGVYGSFAYYLFGMRTPFSVDFRAHGTFGDANFFSMHMGVSFFLALFYRDIAEKPGRWLYPLMALHVLCVVLAASRSAMLAFVFGLCVFWFFSTTFRTKIALGVAGIALLAMLVALPDKQLLLESNPFTARLATTTFDVTKTDRRDLWENALAAFLTSPALGVGYGNSPYFNPQLAGRMQEAHNTYLSVASEVGLIGLAAFLAAMFYFPAVLYLDSRCVPPEAAAKVYPAIVAAFAVIAVAAIPVNCENYRGWWMLMAVAFSYREIFPVPVRRPLSERCAQAAAGARQPELHTRTAG